MQRLPKSIISWQVSHSHSRNDSIISWQVSHSHSHTDSSQVEPARASQVEPVRATQLSYIS
jgi:hypothetical protein